MNIYLIAGPPGIGKSTNARAFIPPAVPIIDQDLAAYQYKKEGFTDYQDIASMSTRQRIQSNLFAGDDFALELNLGFPSHYDYLKSIAAVNPANQISLLLFFTDDLNLCINRAAIRYRNGGHEVRAEIVTEMYGQTIPLFTQNKAIFSSVRLVDVTDTASLEPYQEDAHLPNWIRQNALQQYLPTAKPLPAKRRKQ